MTYTAVRPRCEDCPHNGEALIGEAQAQYLEHIVEELKARRCETCIYDPVCDAWLYITDGECVSIDFCSRWEAKVAPPNGEAPTGASEATDDPPPSSAAAPVEHAQVHDCRSCRIWVPENRMDESDEALGACEALRMVTVATGGGCVHTFQRKVA